MASKDEKCNECNEKVMVRQLVVKKTYAYNASHRTKLGKVGIILNLPKV